jgi:hypothetical protein
VFHVLGAAVVGFECRIPVLRTRISIGREIIQNSRSLGIKSDVGDECCMFQWGMQLHLCLADLGHFHSNSSRLRSSPFHFDLLLWYFLL